MVICRRDNLARGLSKGNVKMQVTNRQTPSRDYLSTMLKYDQKTGSLYWREECEHRMRGQEVAPNSKRVSIGGKNYSKARIIWKLINGSDPIGFMFQRDGNSYNYKIENLADVYHIGMPNFDRKIHFKVCVDSFETLYGKDEPRAYRDAAEPEHNYTTPTNENTPK